MGSLAPLAGSHPWAAIKLAAGLHLVWRFNWGGPASKLTHVGVQSLADCCTERLSGCWPEVSLGPCHRGLSLRTSKEMKESRHGESVALLQPNLFCNQSSAVNSHHFCNSPLVRKGLLVPPTSRGGGLHRIQKQES